jgi:O-antigen/teichoic acid export membrane protein
LHAEGRSGHSPIYVALGFALSALVVGLVITYGLTISRELTTSLVSAAAFSGSELFVNLIQNLLYGELRERLATTLLFLRRIVPLSFLLAASLVSPAIAFQALTLGYIATSCLAVVFHGPKSWPGWYWRDAVLGSRHYWSANTSSMLQQLDVPIISGLVGSTAAGAYSAAFRLANPVHIVTSSLVSLYVPRLSSEFNLSTRRAVGRSLLKWGSLYSAFLILISPLTVFLGPWLLGDSFQPFALLFPICMINSALSVINQLQTARLYSDGRVVTVSVAGAVAAALGLSIVVIASLAGNVYFAAIGTATIQAVLLIWFGVALLRQRTAQTA